MKLKQILSFYQCISLFALALVFGCEGPPNPATITSIPVEAATVGVDYIYTVEVDDAFTEKVSFRLTRYPARPYRSVSSGHNPHRSV